MNHIQYLDDRQLQEVAGGGHNKRGMMFGEFFSDNARTDPPGLREFIVERKELADMQNFPNLGASIKDFLVDHGF